MNRRSWLALSALLRTIAHGDRQEARLLHCAGGSAACCLRPPSSTMSPSGFPHPSARSRPHFLLAVLRLPGGNIRVVRVAPLIPALEVGWRWPYYPPEAHSRIGQAELEMIFADQQESDAPQRGKTRLRWSDLLNLPRTWFIIIAQASTDPVFISHHAVVPHLPGRKG